jgi:D-sedoheptulose 7-phosphate isomerase
MATELFVADTARQRVADSLETTRRLLEGGELDRVAVVAALVADAYRGGGKTILFGNGGSAADAQHVAAEFLGRYLLERPSLPAIALSEPSSLTAIGNDYAFADVFARQIEGLGRPGDVAIGISTSGSSENVIRGIRAARVRGMLTIGLTGANGRRLEEAAEHCIVIPSGETPRIQEGHILVCHVLCELVEQELFA